MVPIPTITARNGSWVRRSYELIAPVSCSDSGGEGGRLVVFKASTQADNIVRRVAKRPIEVDRLLVCRTHLNIDLRATHLTEPYVHRINQLREPSRV